MENDRCRVALAVHSQRFLCLLLIWLHNSHKMLTFSRTNSKTFIFQPAPFQELQLGCQTFKWPEQMEMGSHQPFISLQTSRSSMLKSHQTKLQCSMVRSDHSLLQIQLECRLQRRFLKLQVQAVDILHLQLLSSEDIAITVRKRNRNRL